MGPAIGPRITMTLNGYTQYSIEELKSLILKEYIDDDNKHLFDTSDVDIGSNDNQIIKSFQNDKGENLGFWKYSQTYLRNSGHSLNLCLLTTKKPNDSQSFGVDKRDQESLDNGRKGYSSLYSGSISVSKEHNFSNRSRPDHMVMDGVQLVGVGSRDQDSILNARKEYSGMPSEPTSATNKFNFVQRNRSHHNYIESLNFYGNKNRDEDLSLGGTKDYRFSSGSTSKVDKYSFDKTNRSDLADMGNLNFPRTKNRDQNLFQDCKKDYNQMFSEAHVREDNNRRPSGSTPTSKKSEFANVADSNLSKSISIIDNTVYEERKYKERISSKPIYDNENKNSSLNKNKIENVKVSDSKSRPQLYGSEGASKNLLKAYEKKSEKPSFAFASSAGKKSASFLLGNKKCNINSKSTSDLSISENIYTIDSSISDGREKCENFVVNSTSLCKSKFSNFLPEKKISDQNNNADLKLLLISSKNYLKCSSDFPESKKIASINKSNSFFDCKRDVETLSSNDSVLTKNKSSFTLPKSKETADVAGSLSNYKRDLSKSSDSTIPSAYDVASLLAKINKNTLSVSDSKISSLSATPSPSFSQLTLNKNVRNPDDSKNSSDCNADHKEMDHL